MFRRIHPRIPYIAFPVQAEDIGLNFTPVPLFTVEIESVVPVLTVFTPSRFTPLLNTILTINGRGIYKALSVMILILANPL